MFSRSKRDSISRFALVLAALASIIEAAFGAPPQQPARSVSADQPFFFVVMADPQFGWYKDDMAQETANMDFAVASINRLKPAFVVVCGDLTQTPMDPVQTAAYKAVFRKLAPDIHLYNVPGNHDVYDAKSLAYYRENYGPDYYSFRKGDFAGFVIDNPLMKWNEGPIAAAASVATQSAWLKSALQKAKDDGMKHLVVFQHVPWFLWGEDEGDVYFNMPQAAMRVFLPLLKEFGVSYVFSGHMHQNWHSHYGEIQFVTTDAMSQSFSGDRDGFRIVVVRGSGLEQQFYDLGDIPHAIDLSKPLAPPAVPGWQ